MAAINTTPNQVAMVNEVEPQCRTYIAAANINAGQPVYLNANGKVDLARANSVGTALFVGIALRTVLAGAAVTVIQRGSIYGIDLSGVAYGGQVFLSSATAGGLDTAVATGTGNVAVAVGQCLSMSDAPSYTKVLFVDAPVSRILAALP